MRCMSLLLNCQSLEKSFGSQELFQDLSLSVFLGDRIGLIGPNGAGKSTLLKILSGREPSDAGNISIKKDLRIGYVPQMSDVEDASPLEILLATFREEDSLPDYERRYLAETWLSKLGFPESESSAALLSGGWKKRLLIAKALLHEPDVVFFDEPTNHLDLEGIIWLETFLLRELKTFVIVSHDRYFLENVTNKTMEINRLYPKGILSIEGSYNHFLESKAQFIEGQLEQERSIAGKVRRETDWVRRSPKARTTKSQSRLDAADEIFKEHKELQRRNTQKTADIRFESSERQTQQLVVMKNLRMEIGGKLLFKNLDMTIAPGTRLGLMGPNGSGKTTFLKLLAGELSPTQGTLKEAQDLKIVYFDQHRDKLSLDITLREALSPDGDHVYFQGRPIHVNGWCKKFLFSPDYLGMPIKKLSGGERARIAIARLMLKPADLLLLDEPTNDLDIETLETLEETLREFPGAVVLITHDRCMLDRLCNVFLALGDPEEVKSYAEYSQWEAAQSKKPVSQENKKIEKESSTPNKKSGPSYKEKKEAEQIEKTIYKEEKELEELKSKLTLDSIIKDPKKLEDICKKIAVIEDKITALYSRWSEIEN
jgi:ABC transport system ATP-binding/permease protein